MGQAAKAFQTISFEEYPALKEEAKVKHELVDGVMYGATRPPHQLLSRLVVCETKGNISNSGPT